MNFKVCKILWDIIDYAYPSENEETKKKYKAFYLEIIPKELKTSSGCYYCNGHRIEIYNLSRDSKLIVKTCLHEMAHHIDYCQRHKSAHDDAFYEIYRQLIYTALNMSIITPEQLFMNSTSCDRNKVKIIAEEWVPHKIPYKENISTVTVKNGFKQKEQLHQHGYHWNSLSKQWEIETDSPDKELQFLQSIELSGQIQDASDLTIQAVGFLLCTSKNTYPYKDALKKAGFFFSSNKQWKLKIELNSLNEILAKLYQNPELSKLTYALEKQKRR